ncbi:MAG: DoxX family protein [Planctomycetaceae bacterium]
MSTTDQTPPVSPAALWIGRVLSVLPSLLLVMAGGLMFIQHPDFVQNSAKYGYTGTSLHFIGAALLVSVVLYLIPRTAILGAILLTGYLGGAVATHVTHSEPWYIPVIFGAVLWLGLLLRDRKLQAIFPWRK